MAKKISPGFMVGNVVSPDTPDYVVAELRYDSQITLAAGQAATPFAARFEGAPGREEQATGLNKILEQIPLERVAPQFATTGSDLRLRVSAAPASLDQPVSADFVLGGFVQIVPKQAADCKKIVGRLKKSQAVWDAYIAPRPVPAAVIPPTEMAEGSSTLSRNFEPAQGYLSAAPDGIGALEVWPLKGAQGNGVSICDIEGNWNLTHEDLPPGITLIGGELITEPGWRDHGSAVLGEMVSRPGAIGTVGISPQAGIMVQSALINGVFNTAGAIMNAAAHLNAGDVILIELQAIGPNGKYVAMQYWNDIFTAIRAATQRGISVVEAAGNGDENFDLPVFANTGLQKDAGAIVVGAGVPPTNYFDFFGAGPGKPGYSTIGVPRSRIWFSNYGKIVSLQGWGWHVATLGYGNAQGGPSENTWYTLRFSGTSSASPIVTGAVACLQGRARAVKGAPLTPARVRSILQKTGTPQQAGSGVPLTQNIGPLPNLAKAVRAIKR